MVYIEPKQQLVAIKRADGSVSLMAFITRGRGSILPSDAVWIEGLAGWWARAATPRSVEAEVQKACVDNVHGPALGWRLLKDGEAPTDRAFRDAWTDTGTQIVHDMEKAREILRNRLRGERAPMLQELDVEWMRALEVGGDVSAITAQKQALRDITDDPRIDAAQTVDELKKVTLPDGKS